MLMHTKKYSTLQPFVCVPWYYSDIVRFYTVPSDSVVFRQKTFYVTYPNGFTRKSIYEHGYSYVKAMCAQSMSRDQRAALQSPAKPHPSG